MQGVKLSIYGSGSQRPAPVSAMMAQFADDFRDSVDINLGVGYVNEQTIARDEIRLAMEQVLANPDKYRAALNYGGPTGSRNLTAALRDYYQKQAIGQLNRPILDRKQVVIGASGATSLLDAIACSLEPGYVVTTDPIYYIYGNQLERMGFELLAVPEDDAGLQTDALAAKIGAMSRNELEKISFFYIVTVNNPTCSILSNERRRRLIEIATKHSRQLGRRVPVIMDTAYEQLIHDPAVERPQSGLLFDKADLVYEIGTLSKILAPALRIGYLIGPPDSDLTRAVVQKISDVGFSAPLLNQEMASWLLEHHVERQVASVNAGYHHKAARTARFIDQHLGSELEAIRGGQAGFYYYLTFRTIETHPQSPFFRYLTRTTGDPAIDGPPNERRPRVIYVPGTFCVHPQGEMTAVGKRQLRISYGFESLEAIERALAIMGEAAEYAAAMR